jgi:hypothetical protein
MQDELGELFEKAFGLFLEKERANIVRGTSERNLCCRLAIVLERLKDEYGLAAYYADTEYNRNKGGRVKTILDDQLKVILITCDVILHSRSEVAARDNLIAIEMKKVNLRVEVKNKDRDRLRAMTKPPNGDVWPYDEKINIAHVCGYELGIFIDLDCKRQTFTVEEYRGGQHVNSYAGSF